MATTTTGGIAGWVAAAAGLAIAALAGRAFALQRGTTLAAPAAWAIIAGAALAAVQSALAWDSHLDGTLGASLARYTAAVGTFCPLMAVLGAKRPQDRGWQWVVLSLWIVLLVPAGQAWAARSGNRLELSAAWQLMLGALLVLGVLNYLPTRHGWSALIVVAGQCLLLAEFFGMSGLLSSPDANRCLGICAIALAAAWASRQRTTGDRLESGGLAPFDDRWLKFRDRWGAFWGLRILNRINETAALSAWPVRLQWGGFALIDGEAPGAVDERVAGQVERALDSLLRRFERT